MLSGAINIFGSMLLEKGIELAIEGLVYLATYQDRLIEKGQEAKQSILEQSKAYQTQKSTLTDLAKKYEDLSSGVSISGNKITNKSLSDDQYQEFLQTSNEIAASAPSLVSAWDSEGNAILNVNSQMGGLNKQIENYLNLQRNLTHYEVKDKIEDQYKGIVAQSKQYNSDIEMYKNQEERALARLDYMDKARETLNNSNDKIVTLEFLSDDEQSIIDVLNDIDIPVLRGMYNNEVGEQIVTFDIDTSNIDVSDLERIDSVLQSIGENALISQSEAEAQLRTTQNLNNQNWNEILPSIQTLVNTTSMFDGWDDVEMMTQFQDALSSMATNINRYDLEKGINKTGKDIYNYTLENIIAPLSNATDEQKEWWVKLFEFDPGKMPISEAAKARDKILETIADFDTDDLWTKSTLAKAFGFAYTGENGDTIWYNKERLDNIENAMMSEGEQVRKWINDNLNQEEFEIAYSIIGSGNQKALQDLQSFIDAVNMAIAAKDNFESEPIKFSSLLTDDDSSLNTAVDNFQSVTSSIQESLDKLKNGDEIDLTDLIQEFPELAGQTDNLQKALNNLKIEKLQEFASQWKSAISDLSGDELDIANNFYRNLINSIDLSGADLENVRNTILSNVLPDASDTIERRMITDAWNDLYNKFGDTAEGKEIILKMSTDTTNAKKSIDDLIATYEATSIETTAYVKWDEETPNLDRYNEDKDKKNAGDRYLEMKSIFEDAQKAYEEGLTGTKDFQNAAAMLSPNEMIDPENWAENYSKVTRYFTDDATGVLNFLNDLEATGEQLAVCDEATGKWTLNLDDMQYAADKLGISYETLTAILGRLGDYGFTNDFFSSVEEGQDHLANLYGDLARSEAKLQELEQKKADGDTNVTDAVLGQQESRIQQIRNSILTTEDFINQLAERSLEERQAEIESGAKIASEYIKQLGETDDTRVVQSLLRDIQSLNDEYSLGLEFETENGLLKLVEESIKESQLYADKNPIEVKTSADPVSKIDLTNRPNVSAQTMRDAGYDVEDGSYATVFSRALSNEDETKTIVYTPILPDGSVLDDSTASYYINQALSGAEIEQPIILATFDGEDSVRQANNYSAALHEIQKAYYSEDEELQNLISSVQEYTKEQLMSIDFNDRMWDQNGLAEAERGIESMLNTFGLTYDQVGALIQVLDEMGLVSIPEIEPIPIEYAPDTSELETANQEVENPISKDVEYKPDTSEIEIVNNKVTQSEIKPVSTDSYLSIRSNLEQKRSSMQLLSTEPVQQEAAYDVPETIITKAVFDTSEADVALNDYVQNLESIPKAAPSGGSSVDINILDAQESISIITDGINKIPDGTSVINVDDQASDNIQNATNKIYAFDSSNANPTIDVTDFASSEISRITRELDELDGKTATVTVTTHKTSDGGEAGGAGSQFATGTLLSPARADGTIALAKAHADGNVALQEDQDSLVNELGMESLIRDGVWRLIPGGPHVESLKKGDIILNAKQTADLLKHGETSSYGKAYASGTAYDGISALYGGGGSEGKITVNGETITSSGNKADSGLKNVGKSADEASSALDKLIESLDKLMDWIEVRRNYKQSRIDLRLAESENEIGYRNKNKKVAAAQNITKSLINVDEKAYDRYMKQAAAVGKKLGMSKKLMEKARTGKIDIEELTEDEKKQVEQYQIWIDKARAVRQEIEKLKTSQKELAQQKLDNIINRYDGILSLFASRAEGINNDIEQAELRGFSDSGQYYIALQNDIKIMQDKRAAEIAALEASLQADIDAGIIIPESDTSRGSEEWYKMTDQIYKAKLALDGYNTQYLEYEKNRRDIQWAREDQKQEAVENLNDEADFLQKLMQEEDEKVYDENGNITDIGKATYGLHGLSYNVDMNQAETYAKRIAALDAEIAKPENAGNEDLIEERERLLGLQRDSILAAEDEKQAIVDLVKDGIEAQLSALKKLIDKYKDAINSQKNLYDYQKNVKEQAEEVAKLQKRLAAYAGDDSEEGRLRRQETEKALKEAQQNLEETQYDKFISDQEELLDDMYEQYEEVLNDRLDNIDLLIENVISGINANSTEIQETLKAQAASVGITLSDSMDKIWGSEGTGMKVLTTYTDNFGNSVTTVTNAIDEVKSAVEERHRIADEIAKKQINETQDDYPAPGADNGGNPTRADIQNIVSQGTAHAQKASDEEAAKHSALWTYLVNNFGYAAKEGTAKAIAEQYGIAVSDKVTAEEKDKILAALKADFGDEDAEIMTIIKSGKKRKKSLTKDEKKSKSALWQHIVTKYGYEPYDGMAKKLAPYFQVSIASDKPTDDEKNKLLAAMTARGYARGTDYVDKDEWARVFENGREIIALNDGSVIMPFERGDGVLNNAKTEQLIDLANNHDAIMGMIESANVLMKYNQGLAAAETERRLAESMVVNNNAGGNSIVNHNQFIFNLSEVTDHEEFMRWATHDKDFENMIAKMSIAKMNGKSSINKYR